jgi:hypothetical protein
LRLSDIGQLLILSTRETDEPLPRVSGMTAYRLGLSEGRTMLLEEGDGAAA